MRELPRWHAVATYRTSTGLVDVPHDIEELEDLDQLIEAGPDWNALVEIKITLQRSTGLVTLTAAGQEPQ